jgi:hypothetical protein
MGPVTDLQPPAREQLEIVWHGTFVPGVIFYGLCPEGRWRDPGFPFELWPEGTEAEPSMLRGEGWEVAMWTLAIAAWPRGDEWRRALRGTMQCVIAGGAVVAWLGMEGGFCDPPDLFEPDCMSDAVLAALLPDGTFLCPADPDEPWAALSDEELARLREAAAPVLDRD